MACQHSNYGMMNDGKKFSLSSLIKAWLSPTKHCTVMTPTVKSSPACFASLAVLFIILKLCGTVWLHNSFSDPSPTCPTYFGDNDYPRSWDIGGGQRLMSTEESIHYQLDTPQANLEWRALVPANGTIYLGPERRPYTISMFQQLRCLDIICTELLSARGLDTPIPPSELSRHCFDYLRQTTLCRDLVRVLNPDNAHPFRR